MSRMADLVEQNKDRLVERWNLDLQEQFELWADMKNKQGFTYERNKKTEQDFLIFIKGSEPKK